MAKYMLYGDGIHDDQPAIQEMLDSGICEVVLPAPSVCYLLTKPLTISSCCKLKLPRFAEIKLADGANCFMIQNKAVFSPKKRLRPFLSAMEHEFWKFIDLLSPEPKDACTDFEIEGGIWNFNNRKQDPNPLQTQHFDERNFLGHTMFFYNVRNFRLANLTLKDPSNFAVMIDTGSHFTIENIRFDFNNGNPYAVNMDGIHLNGNCHYGVIRNLQGACYDDLVALNAHEGSGGDITNIQIDGLFAEHCHSAVRLLTVNHNIQHIDISNVYGTYYQYCIGLTKYYEGETTGCFDAINVTNLHASKAKRLPVQEMHMPDKTEQFPFFWMQSGTVVNDCTIRGLHRREFENPVDTIHIDENALVKRLTIEDLTLENHTGKPCAGLVNNGTIEQLRTEGLDEHLIQNNGMIQSHIS